VLNRAEELNAIENLDVFPQHVLVILRKLVQSDIYDSYTELSPNWKTITTLCEPFEASNLVRKHDSAFDAFAHEHPLVNHVKKGWINRVIKFSDFFNRIRFHNMALYTEYYKKTDVEFQISFSVPNLESNTAFAINRKHRDFTERERLLLILFRAHVILTYRHLYETARFLDKLALLQAGIEADGKGLILLSMNGEPCCTTDRARQWLKEYFQSPESWRKGLPSALSDWVHHQATTGRGEARTPFVVARNGRRLHICFLNGENQGSILLLTEETAEGISPDVLSKSLALTPRETEVLSWIAKGKTSHEIGKILGLSFRTIDKHLEYIYGKLGVENRTGAVARACEIVFRRSK
jgi:DNA-binding CsgD family transcriptional regulator